MLGPWAGALNKINKEVEKMIKAERAAKNTKLAKQKYSRELKRQRKENAPKKAAEKAEAKRQRTQTFVDGQRKAAANAKKKIQKTSSA